MVEDENSVEKFVIKKNGMELDAAAMSKFLNDFQKFLQKSFEFKKIHANTQVYNVIQNGVTNRGTHSEGVANVAQKLAEIQAKKAGKTAQEIENAGILAYCLGMMHDLGHTPFGHDGESALDGEMARFKTSGDDKYIEHRKGLLGSTYVENADFKTVNGEKRQIENYGYEHNETSAIIGGRLLEEFAKAKGYEITPGAMQYVKTGILAHSTSRVQENPAGLEQQAVRLADKVAYVPQDLADLLRQGIINIEELTPSELNLMGLNADNPNLTEAQKSVIKEIISELQTGRITQNNTRALDTIIEQKQQEIAEQCFSSGEMVSKKEVFDELSNFANQRAKDREGKKLGDTCTFKDKKGNDHTISAEQDKDKWEAMEKLDELNSLCDKGASTEEINRATEELKALLVSKFKFPAVLADVWISKHKYQDRFIEDKLVAHGQSLDNGNKNGIKKGQKLSEINQRNDTGWKMKVVFQSVYSNYDAIPENFKKLEEKGLSKAQVASMYVASLSNGSLQKMYNGLQKEGLIVSREDSIKEIIAKQKKIEVSAVQDSDIKDFNERVKSIREAMKNNPRKIKISDGDAIEALYESVVGKSIVAGKSKEIQPSGKQVTFLEEYQKLISAPNKQEATTSKIEPIILKSAVKSATNETTFDRVQKLIENIEQDKAHKLEQELNTTQGEHENGG